MTKAFVVRETAPGEKRVAATPETIKKMVAAGLEVVVERGAGAGIFVADTAFEAAGARMTTERTAELEVADLVLSVVGLPVGDITKLRRESLLIGLLRPLQDAEGVEALVKSGSRSIAMELIPRTTRAQEMDVLSSQASIAGYKAVLLAAGRLGKYFPLLMTAAGTIPPARVVIMGAGVAGLQAVATARRLGAIVEVSDVRAAVKEQVESLGGKFIELPKVESGEGQGGYAREMSAEFLAQQREIVTRHVAQADVVICTALVPGKKAPTLLTRAMVEGMKPGSLIVDLAVSQGGNCELSRAGEEVQHHGTLILGPTNLPAETAFDASMLYARNLWALLKILVKNGELVLDTQDDIVDAALLTVAGEVRHAPTRASLEGAK